MITVLRPFQLTDPITILYPDGEVLGTVQVIRTRAGQLSLRFDLPDELTLVRAPKAMPEPVTTA
jgi:hypothetical protein